MSTQRQRRVGAAQALAILGAASLLAAACNSGNKTAPAPKPTGITRWVHSDLRGAGLGDVRLAAARAAELCRDEVQAGIAVPITGAIRQAANLNSVPDTLATTLACALDAPSTATCDDIKSCSGQTSSLPGTAPRCDSQTLIAHGATSDRVVSLACSAFGEKCYTTRVGGTCATGECKSGETYRCDGDTVVACTQGLSVRTPCGRGMTCGERADTGMVDCVGKGPACQGGERCDGDVAVRCEGGHEARLDCAAWGLGCDSTGSRATCVIKHKDCDPTTDAARCKGKSLEICVAGSWWDASCGSLRHGTSCKPGIGYDGEAGCG